MSAKCHLRHFVSWRPKRLLRRTILIYLTPSVRSRLPVWLGPGTPFVYWAPGLRSLKRSLQSSVPKVPIEVRVMRQLRPNRPSRRRPLRLPRRRRGGSARAGRQTPRSALLGLGLDRYHDTIDITIRYVRIRSTPWNDGGNVMAPSHGVDAPPSSAVLPKASPNSHMLSELSH